MKILIERKVNIDDVPDANKHGNCYETAVNTMMKFGDDDSVRLVHGIVTGQGPIEGIQYGHAWVEKGDKVIDNTVPITIDKDIYYLIGKIDYTHEYTYQEMLNELIDKGHYGPWDKEFDNYN